MKRFGFFVISLIVVGLFLNGCDTITGSDTKTQYYYYEFFRVSKSNFDSVSFPTTDSFSAIKSYKNNLKTYSVEALFSGTDATQQDIYELMTSRGFSVEEANREISFLNSVGNDVIIFQYAFDSSYYIIAYVEKL